jgi:hypothetical protein
MELEKYFTTLCEYLYYNAEFDVKTELGYTYE